MALGYRMLGEVGSGLDVVGLVAEQFLSWLRGPRRGLDVDRVGRGLTVFDEGARLSLVEHTGQDGSHSRRYRLSEERTDGPWVTSLTVHHSSGRKPSWVWLDIGAPESRGARDTGSPFRSTRWTAVPRLARDLLAVLQVTDGEVVLGECPSTLRVDDVGRLIDAICGPDRRTSLLVAGSSGDFPLPPWREQVSAITREVVGLAAMHVLDPAATEVLAREVGPSHAVPAGAIRTYLPGADPASSVEGGNAERFAKRSLEMVDGYDRGKTFNITLLAIAHAQQGDVERACAVGSQALDLAAAIKSARTVRYIKDLRTRLKPFINSPEVHTFDERATRLLRRPTATVS